MEGVVSPRDMLLCTVERDIDPVVGGSPEEGHFPLTIVDQVQDVLSGEQVPSVMTAITCVP